MWWYDSTAVMMHVMNDDRDLWWNYKWIMICDNTTSELLFVMMKLHDELWWYFDCNYESTLNGTWWLKLWWLRHLRLWYLIDVIMHVWLWWNDTWCLNDAWCCMSEVMVDLWNEDWWWSTMVRDFNGTVIEGRCMMIFDD